VNVAIEEHACYMYQRSLNMEHSLRQRDKRSWHQVSRSIETPPRPERTLIFCRDSQPAMHIPENIAAILAEMAQKRPRRSSGVFFPPIATCSCGGGGWFPAPISKPANPLRMSRLSSESPIPFDKPMRSSRLLVGALL